MTQQSQVYRHRAIALSAFLILALLAAALPQPARAAVTCRAYHWVKKGETTQYIAHTWGLKWRYIAYANEMNPWEKPEVGQRLCIPSEETSQQTTSGKTDEKTSTRTDQPEDEEDARITVSISGGRIHVTLSRFDNEHRYLVKARDVSKGVGGWYRLGYVSVDDDTNETFSFDRPRGLQSFTVLSVCLKDQKTDELICRNAVNP